MVHTVQFHGNGGTLISGDETQLIPHGGHAILPIYTMDGFAMRFDSSHMNITEDTDINVIWLELFTVTFDGNGGTLITGNPVQQVAFGESANPPVYTNGDLALTWDLSFDHVTEDMTVTAIWNEGFTVTFDGNGGILVSGQAIQTVISGGDANPPSFFLEGHNLTWDTDFTNVTEDLTVHAIWTIRTYQVTFDASGGTLISGETTQIINHGGAALAPIFAKEGHTFLGWSTTFDVITSHLEVIAMWYAPTFVVTFISDQGTLISGFPSQVVKYGEDALAPVYAYPGHTLSWDVDFTSVTSDLTVTAIWTPFYTVTFDVNGGTLVSGDLIQVINHGDSAIAPVFIKTGYDLSFDLSFDEVTSDLFVTAIWTIKTFTVTFEIGSATLISGDLIQTVSYGAGCHPP